MWPKDWLMEAMVGSLKAEDDQAVKGQDMFAVKLMDGTEPTSIYTFNEEKETLLVLKQREGTNYFPIYHAHGSYIFNDKPYNYLVMTLLGKSLEQLVEEQFSGKFSLFMALHVGINCLNAIEEFHRAGFIHRDIKPSNFAVSRDKKDDKIYLLDFGVAKRSDGRPIQSAAPRLMISICGTPLYMSENAHLGQEQSIKDDLESWFYLLMRVTTGKLPWQDSGEQRLTPADMLEKKQNLKKNSESSLAEFPRKYLEILKYITKMKSDAAANYATLRQLLNDQIELDLGSKNCVLQAFYSLYKRKTTPQSSLNVKRIVL